jgi:hypothetical protein
MVTIVVLFHMNRGRSRFPMVPPSPFNFCVSAVSFSDLFPSPLASNPSASSGVTFIDAASTLTPLFATLTKNTRGVGTSASPSTLLGPSFFMAVSRTHTNARNSFFFQTFTSQLSACPGWRDTGRAMLNKNLLGRSSRISKRRRIVTSFISLCHYFIFSPSSILSSTAPGSSGIPISRRSPHDRSN